MTRPRIRIGTLLLLVVIAALAVALVVERRRSTRQAARVNALVASRGEQVARAVQRERAALDIVAQLQAEAAEVTKADPDQQAIGTKESEEAKIARLIREMGIDTNHAIASSSELVLIGKAAVPKLIEALRHRKAEVRWATIGALGQIGTVPPDILPALIGALDRVSSPPGWYAPFDVDEGAELALALRQMGPAAVPALSKALDHERAFARATAAMALGELAHGEHGMAGRAAADRKPVPLKPEAIARLIVLLEDQAPSVRMSAAVALASVDPHAGSADAIVNALARHVRDPYGRVRGSVVFALSRFGPRSKVALPALMALFRTKREEGTGLRSTIAALTGMDDVPAMHNLVAEAIGALGKEATPAMSMLLEAAKSPDVDLREDAVCALGIIGPRVEGAMKAVRGALADPEIRVRNRAEAAIMGYLYEIMSSF